MESLWLPVVIVDLLELLFAKRPSRANGTKEMLQIRALSRVITTSINECDQSTQYQSDVDSSSMNIPERSNARLYSSLLPQIDQNKSWSIIPLTS